MEEQPGTLLAKAVCKLSATIADKLDKESFIPPEEGNKILFDVITDFNQEMAKNGYITAGAFDILLMAVANYSLLERQIMHKSGKDVDTHSRRDIIEKAFHMISTGETLTGKHVLQLDAEAQEEAESPKEETPEPSEES